MHSEIIELIDSDIKKWIEFLSSGRAVDYADYKRVTGVVAGLDAAKTIVRYVRDNENDDEDSYDDE